MPGRTGNTLVRALAFATSLAGAIAAGETASAQEAIMLETIGAVRMALPEEAQQMTAEQEETRQHAQEQPRRQVRKMFAY